MKFRNIAVNTILFVLTLTITTRAAVLTSVPRQGGMLMPVVRYHSDSDSITIDLSSATNVIPQLTPLLVSNPNDRFSPSDPWFNDLDPSRKGLAFSAVMGGTWIR